MRSEAKALAVELTKIELQLKPLLQRKEELRRQLTGKLPLGDPEVVNGFLFHAYEKTNLSFDEVGLLKALGDRASEVTVPKLDSTKLDAALKLGRIKQEELEPFSDVSVSKVLMIRSSNGEEGRRNHRKVGEAVPNSG